MHTLTPGHFPHVFWIALVVIVACLVFIHMRGRYWNNNCRWSLYVPAFIAIVAAVVALIAGGAWWFLA